MKKIWIILIMAGLIAAATLTCLGTASGTSYQTTSSTRKSTPIPAKPTSAPALALSQGCMTPDDWKAAIRYASSIKPSFSPDDDFDGYYLDNKAPDHMFSLGYFLEGKCIQGYNTIIAIAWDSDYFEEAGEYIGVVAGMSQDQELVNWIQDKTAGCPEGDQDLSEVFDDGLATFSCTDEGDFITIAFSYIPFQ